MVLITIDHFKEIILSSLLKTGGLKVNPLAGEISIVHETPVSAKINGSQRCGMVVVSNAVDTAIKKAQISGIGIVGCSNYSSATGALGHWANVIAKHNLIALVMSQCPEMVAPHGSYEPIFGTNPLAIGIPTLPRPQILDMATSAAAWYSLEIAKANNSDIPDNIAYDSNGNNTNNPIEAMKGALKVFDRSYKGSHLALMIELLAGSWTGAAMNDKKNSNNWGSLVIAINPNILGPVEEFQNNSMIMCDRVKNAHHLTNFEDKEIFLPGERGSHGDTISKCQKMLDEIYINIFDYVDGDYEDHVFDNKRDLMRRCRNRGFFPKDEAKSQGLKDLLETFFSNRN
eukprot:gene19794-25736_t